MATEPFTPQEQWQPTTATVVSCRRTWETWFVDEASPDEAGMYELAKWIVRFEYEINGSVYRGTYKANSPKAPGEAFRILYDPANPQRNTGSDRPMKLWVRAVAITLGLAVLWTLIRYFPEWLQ